MEPRIPAIILTCLLMIIATATAFAQFDTAVVLGTVRDPNGAILPKATVTLKNIATGVAATAQTDDDGNYQFFNVKIGAYQVTAEAQGFARPGAAQIVPGVEREDEARISYGGFQSLQPHQLHGPGQQRVDHQI